MKTVTCLALCAVLLISTAGFIYAAEGDSFSITERPKVLVLPFEDTNPMDTERTFGRAVEEMVVTALMKQSNNVNVLTQKTLNDLLSARAVGVPDDLSQPNLQRLESLGLIDAYVYGTVSWIENSLEVDLRLVDAKTTQVISVRNFVTHTIRFNVDGTPIIVGASERKALEQLTSLELSRNVNPRLIGDQVKALNETLKSMRSDFNLREQAETAVGMLVNDYLEPFCGQLLLTVADEDKGAKLYIKPSVRLNTAGELVASEFSAYRQYYKRYVAGDDDLKRVSMENNTFNARVLHEQQQATGEKWAATNLLQGRYDIRMVKGEGYQDVVREVEILRGKPFYLERIEFQKEYGNLVIADLIENGVIYVIGTSPWNSTVNVKMRTDGTFAEQPSTTINVEKQDTRLVFSRIRSGQYTIFVYKQMESFPGTINLSYYSFVKEITVSEDKDQIVSIVKPEEMGEQTLSVYLKPFLPEGVVLRLYIDNMPMGIIAQAGEIVIRDINPGRHDLSLRVAANPTQILFHNINYGVTVQKGRVAPLWVDLLDGKVITQEGASVVMAEKEAPAAALTRRTAPPTVKQASSPALVSTGPALTPEETAAVVGGVLGLTLLIVLLATGI